MTTHKQKPVEVDARQYTGGEENGRMLMEWVNSVTPKKALYRPENRSRGLVLPELMSVVLSRETIRLTKGDWIVHRGNMFYSMTNAEFEQGHESL